MTMIYAYIVLNFFAAAWCIWGLQAAGLPTWSWGLAAMVSLVIGALCLRANAGAPRRPPEEGARIGRLIGIWSGVEVAGLLVVVNVLTYAGRERLVVPAVAVVVGLHFFPLARGIPAPAYGVLAWALVVLGGGAMLLPGPYPAPVAAFGAAILLWSTCIGMVRRV